MKISSRPLLITCSLVFFSAVNLAAAPTAKLGYVDYDRAIKEEKEAQKYFKDLEAEEIALAGWEGEVKATFEKKMEDYKKTMEKLNEKQRKVKEEELGAEISKLQQESTSRRQKLADNQQKRLEELKLKNNKVVEDIAEKQGLSVVFNAATLVWVSNKPTSDVKDLTPELIKQYNTKHPVKAAAPAAASPAAKPADAKAPAAPKK